MNSKQLGMAETEAMFREVNEAIEDVARTHGDDHHVYGFLCECGDPNCVDMIDMSMRNYERLRQNGSRFAIVEGHDTPSIETIVAKNVDFSTVEMFGEASDLAEACNPRL